MKFMDFISKFYEGIKCVEVIEHHDQVVYHEMSLGGLLSLFIDFPNASD